MSYVIQYQAPDNRSYYRFMSGIGPCFGSTKDDCIKFASREAALKEKWKFPAVADIMSEIVEIEDLKYE